ncbi:MAG: radical SAM protein [Patescibacteria group bacterium]|nr:radical SAM protein [Patescibacteria group bacterium]
MSILRQKVFLLDIGDRHVVFSGELGFIAEVNPGEKNEVAAYLDSPSFDIKGLSKIVSGLNPERLNSRPVTDEARIEGKFHPTAVMLFPTLDCQLRCTYCYSSGGSRKTSMENEIAKVAIDYVADNATEAGIKNCGLELHGGGEPTKNWFVSEFAITRLEDICEHKGLSPFVSLATNGMLSQQQTRFLADHVSKVQISLDGPPEIQNAQRPVASGAGSFQVAARAVSDFLAHGLDVTIHSVITERSAGNIPEIVRFFCENFPGATIQVEPAFPCGRGLITKERFPAISSFVRGFVEAISLAKSFGVELVYSGVDPNLTSIQSIFCGVTLPNFIVTPTGLVTACNEVGEVGHPLARWFIYGSFDLQTKRFVFNQERIKWLQNKAPRFLEQTECGQCFIYSTCLGECLVKNLGPDGSRDPSFINPRCSINREIAKLVICNKIESGGGE